MQNAGQDHPRRPETLFFYSVFTALPRYRFERLLRWLWKTAAVFVKRGSDWRTNTGARLRIIIHTLSMSDSLSFSLSHTHTHSLSLSLSLSHTYTLSLCLWMIFTFVRKKYSLAIYFKRRIYIYHLKLKYVDYFMKEKKRGLFL